MTRAARSSCPTPSPCLTRSPAAPSCSSGRNSAACRSAASCWPTNSPAPRGVPGGSSPRANIDEGAIRTGLLRIWSVMRECVQAGCHADGVLPGGLKVRRRAGKLLEKLEDTSDPADPLYAMEWVTLYALAVNEQNAAGGRVVTAPTNGAAGI